jgi:FkbM family methyltransferase
MQKYIARIRQICSKLLFCWRVSAGARTFIRLMINGKRLDRYQRANKSGEGHRITRAVGYKIRYFSRTCLVYLRTFSGDIRIFYEIFFEKAYAIPLPFDRKQAVIVDAGANIGMAGLYFSLAYSNARVYCIEPDAGNLQVLRKNLASFLSTGSVVLIEAALHETDGEVNLGGKGWSYNRAVVPSVNGTVSVPAISPGSLIRHWQIERIDLLKVDIEGAEEGIFRGDIGWLDRVDMILIEVHSEEGKNLIRRRLSEKGFYCRPWGSGADLRIEAEATTDITQSLVLAYRKEINSLVLT